MEGKIASDARGEKKKKRERKKGKNSPTGWIPISRIFFVRCTYTRVQRLSLMGWVSWTRTCCYKLIFLARNEFSLSTSTNYSRSIIGIWKRVLIYIYIYSVSCLQRLIRGKYTVTHRVFPNNLLKNIFLILLLRIPLFRIIKKMITRRKF